MEIKAFLRQYRAALLYAERCARDLDALRDVGIRSPRLDGMPRSTGAAGGLEGQVALIDAAERRLNRERDRALSLLDQIEDMIEGLEDYRQKTLIRLRYIDGRSWEQIAIEMHWSERTVYNIHGKALEALRRRESEKN